MKQTRVSSHEYLQIEEEMKEANHDTTDTPEKLKKYDKIDQSQADVHKYTKLDEAEELNLISPTITMKSTRDRLRQIITWKFHKFRKGNFTNSLIYSIGFHMKNIYFNK